MDTPLQVKVMNALGKLIQQISLTEGQGLDLRNQPNGLYFLEWQSQGQAFIQRVLKI